MRTHRPPTTCPVCSESLITLRLGCPSCGTELSGHFETCRFCRLGSADLEILEVFLRSRGNVRDVQAHLEVSYPTARARLSEVLDRLGFGGEPPAAERREEPPPAAPRTVDPSPLEGATASVDANAVGAVLADLAAGLLSVEDAERLLGPGGA